MRQKILVCGAGAWGTALALSFYRGGHTVTLLTKDEKEAEIINKNQENTLYLKGFPIPSGLQVTHKMDNLNPSIIVWVVPIQYSVQCLLERLPYIKETTPIILASKGISASSEAINKDSFLSSIFKKHLKNPIFVLSGPNFASEVAKGLPAAATLAGETLPLAENLATLLNNPLFRLYATDDIMGTQIGGALKNVFAIACGIVVGRNKGQNALSALITRSLAEINRIGREFGAKPETFLGLSAVGDLLLTCSSPQSRNMSLGMELAQGKDLQEILSGRQSVAEGVGTAKAIYSFIKSRNLHLPICLTIYDILYNKKPIDEAIRDFFSTESKEPLREVA